jgi:hypothetical protein
MSRFLLDDSTLARISQELPDLQDLERVASSFAPDVISMSFPPESPIPVAAVCLQDATNTLFEARYALHELFAHRIWYREKIEPPNELAAMFFIRFYADDVASRLYSAGEHLANAIIFMLEIGEQHLKKYKNQRTSQQSAVGNFLKKEKPTHPITAMVLKLAQSKEWKNTVEYRNKCVHEQPPTVEGLEIIYKYRPYKRQKRWRSSATGDYTLELGSIDKPEYSSVDDLVRFVAPASFHFTEALTKVTQFYEQLKMGVFKVIQDRYGQQL